MKINGLRWSEDVQVQTCCCSFSEIGVCCRWWRYALASDARWGTSPSSTAKRQRALCSLPQAVPCQRYENFSKNLSPAYNKGKWKKAKGATTVRKIWSCNAAPDSPSCCDRRPEMVKSYPSILQSLSLSNPTGHAPPGCKVHMPFLSSQRLRAEPTRVMDQAQTQRKQLLSVVFDNIF